MLNTNFALEKLKSGQQIIGTWSLINSPLSIDIICSSGIDFIVIDSEHAPVSFDTAQTLAMICESHGVSPIFRVGGVIEDQILKALDIGMHAIQVPNISSADQLLDLIRYSKYPPIGNRGFSPYTRAGGFLKSNAKKLTELGNSNTFLVVNVEDQFGVDHLGDLLNIDSIDVVFIGLFDLSKSLGAPGAVESPLVLNKLDKAIAKVHASGKKVGSIASSLNGLKVLKKMGVDYITYSVDSGILIEGYNLVCDEWNK